MDARARKLSELLGGNGYVRFQNIDRKAEGQAYKKGWEVRLIAEDESDAQRIETLARSLDFRPGRKFLKGRKYVVPIYGWQAVEAFFKARNS